MCVLCRKAARASSQPPENAGYTLPLTAAELTAGGPVGLLRVVGLMGSLLLLTAGVVYVLKMPPSQPAEPPPPAASAQLVNTAQNQEASELDRAKAADLAASLALLERAEAERIERQKLADAQAEQQRVAAQAALAPRAQEEAERDRARHEAVTKQLDDNAMRQARSRVQVTLYGTDWCGVCTKARAYLQAQNIPFKDFDIDRDKAARARAYALNPRRSVPIISIDKELLIGFSPDSLEDRITRAAQARKL
jgi:glutaredoxin